MHRIAIVLSLVFVGLSASNAGETVLRPSKILRSLHVDTSIPLRHMEMVVPGTRDRTWKDKQVPNREAMPSRRTRLLAREKDVFGADPVLQGVFGNAPTAPPAVNFDGVGNVNGVYPPDINGDAGPNHYFQMVNLSFAIWNRSGVLLYGPADNITLWAGFNGPWTGTNDGDPIVLYDPIADRWLVSQFSLPNFPNGPFYELIAISATPDPLGAWHRYAFEFTDMPDYPHFGVWPDGYYMAINRFSAGTLAWAGAGAVVFERDSMLAGRPALGVMFTFSASADPYSFLPSDLDGPVPPPGSPNYFMYAADGAFWGGSDRLEIYEFIVDWTNTSASTFTGPFALTTAAFDTDLCGFSSSCIPQKGTGVGLDALSDRLMHRVQYRNFGSHQTMVTCHTVDATGGDRAGVRWYELRNTGAGWSIYQQGTYSPDTKHRWMGSIAMDGQGNIALGYSVSSTSMNPAISYTGRAPGDALGTMTITETEIIAGTGSQTGSASRWGDYTMMAVDPVDDATFWYTNEYLSTTGATPWKTRIASFKLGTTSPKADLQMNSYTITGGNANGVIDSSECNDLSVTIQNIGNATAASISATLSTNTPKVTITQPGSNYPNLAAGASAANVIPFQISTDPDFVCGTPVVLTLALSFTGGSHSVTMSVPSGGTGPASRFDNNTVTAIPDNTPAGVEIPIVVSGFSAPIANVTVSFYINHTWDSDLAIKLISPDGTTVNLVSRRGGSGDNFGSACSPDANRTHIADSASTWIRNGSAPFIGTFRPEQPLAAFKGKSANGTWKLRVSDHALADVGNVNCWSLFISPTTCIYGGGDCIALPIQLASFSASAVDAHTVLLEWSTISELNNYGFEVQKSNNHIHGYETIPNSFVPGHGTTIVPQFYSFTDHNASPGTWFYRLKQIDLDGSVNYTGGIQAQVVTDVSVSTSPTEFSLSQNYPNPFNPSTLIRYGVPEQARVRLEVFNTLGERVAVLVDGVKESGYHEAVFNGSGLSSGVYYYRLHAGKFVSTKKLLLLR